MIVDVPTSSVALAVNSVAREKNKVYINSGAGTTDLTGAQCSPNTVHWTYDTYMLAKSTGGATAKPGGNAWYFLTADYVFGQQLQRDAARFVTEAGGKVLAPRPLPVPGHHRLLLLPAARAELGRQGAGPGQRRRGHGELHQAGARVRPDRADEASPPC